MDILLMHYQPALTENAADQLAIQFLELRRFQDKYNKAPVAFVSLVDLWKVCLISYCYRTNTLENALSMMGCLAEQANVYQLVNGSFKLLYTVLLAE